MMAKQKVKKSRSAGRSTRKTRPAKAGLSNAAPAREKNPLSQKRKTADQAARKTVIKNTFKATGQKARRTTDQKTKPQKIATTETNQYTRGQTLSLTHIFGGVATYFAGELFPNRVLRDFEIVWIIAGGARYTQNGVTHELSPGDVVLARPGFVEHYNWDPAKSSRHGYFHFDIKTIPLGWPDPSEWPVQKKFPAGHALLTTLQHLLERWRASGYTRQSPDPRIESILQAALDIYFWDPKTSVDEQGLSEPVVRAIDFLRGMLRVEVTRRLTLAETGRAAGVSAKHLCRCFADELGISPMTYYRLLRLEFAMARLAGSGESLKQISQAAGFSNPYHFSRAFTQVYGLAPSAVRRDLRAGITPPSGPLNKIRW